MEIVAILLAALAVIDAFIVRSELKDLKEEAINKNEELSQEVFDLNIRLTNLERRKY